MAALGSCDRKPHERPVDAAGYDAFWLWAGVRPQPVLAKARTLYLLDGEIIAPKAQFVPLRPQPPHLTKPAVWLVVRTDTLGWTDTAIRDLAWRRERWLRAGNRVVGVQLDFDSATRGIGNYAAFLARVRQALPADCKLSITGLMDWSANGDPRALAGLADIVDEVVIQTYQGSRTIPGYERYLDRLDDFPIPFRVGLVQGGWWKEPAGLSRNPRFRGYVVFLINASNDQAAAGVASAKAT